MEDTPGPPKPRLSSPSTVRELLRRHGIRPRRRWGQHFLCDGNILEKIVTAAELKPEDLVIEPGAGLGMLTLELARRAGRVIAVERDPRLIPLLMENLKAAGAANVEVLQADILELEFSQLAGDRPRARTKVKVVGNLPYAITAPLLEWLTAEHGRLALAVLMVQQEVAEKLLAPPGPGASALGVRVRAFADVALIRRVPRTVFWPPPDVDSALIKLTFLERPRFTADEQVFFKVVRAAFNLRRKTLRGALQRSPLLKLDQASIEEALRRAGIEGTRRGETLTLEEFDRLARAIQELQPQ